jgi:hypothetical protein
MKIYRLPQLSEANPDSRYKLGFEDLKINSVYLVYGRLRPGETGRRLSPTDGHDEIVCVAKGRLLVRGERFEFPVGEGEAFHLKVGDTLIVDNPADDHDAVYVAAGGCGPDKGFSDDDAEKPKETAGGPRRTEEVKAAEETAEKTAAEKDRDLED